MPAAFTDFHGEIKNPACCIYLRSGDHGYESHGPEYSGRGITFFPGNGENVRLSDFYALRSKNPGLTNELY
jgi:hypothetical protein